MNYLFNAPVNTPTLACFSLRPHFPSSTDRSRCVWGDTGWMCVFSDLILTWGRQQRTHFPPESSAAARRLVLIRSPSSLSSLRPQPALPAPFFFPRDSWRSSCKPTGHQTSHPAFTVMSPLIYMWHLPVPFTPRLNLSHSPSAGHRNTAFGRTEHYSDYSVIDYNIGKV